MSSSIRNQEGFTLAELAIALGVGGIVMLTAMAVLSIQDRARLELDTLPWLQAVRTDLIQALRTDGWRKTALSPRNHNLDCVRRKIANPSARVSCSGAGGHLLEVRNGSNEVLFEEHSAFPLNFSRGFNWKGRPCDSFDPVTGDRACPFKYVLSWRPICADPSCSNPDIAVQGQLLFSPGSSARMRVPSQPYSFSLLISADGEVPEVTCEQTLLGSYDPALRRCRMRLHDQCANPNQFLVGFERSGKPICQARALLNGNCGGTGFLQGVDADGNPICTSKCL
ncbi:MAG: prepilin-type N-terminal cleavage/methylation domain-containing protein [Oligoflexia bacterium]|nr:prepilin-type N-terminal cleavage/methylation domain-containing protein [Oligoflexia bacterium]